MLLILFALPGLRAETRRLTLEEAQSLAAKQSSYNKLARLRVTESEKRHDALRAVQYPELRNDSNLFLGLEKQRIDLPAGSIGIIPGLGPIPPANVTVLQGQLNIALSQTTLAQPLTQLVKIRAGIRAAAQDKALASIDADKARTEIAYKVEEAFYGILITDRRIAAAQAHLAAMEEARKEANDAVETGNALKVLSLEAEAAYLQQRNALLTAEITIADIRTEFNDLLGLPLDTQLELVPPAPVADAPADLAVLVAEAQQRNPEVRSALATVAKAKAGIDAAKADYIPEIGIYAQHIWQSGVPFIAPNNGILGARLNWSIFDWGKRNAQIGERKTQLELAEENLRRQRSRVAVEVEKSFRKVERLRGLGAAARKAHELRAESLRIARDQLELGLSTPRAAKLADAALAEAGAQLLESTLGLRLAQAELNKAAGR